MKYEFATGWPILGVLALVGMWIVWQLVLGSTLISAVLSPINIFAVIAAFIMTIGWLQKRRRIGTG